MQHIETENAEITRQLQIGTLLDAAGFGAAETNFDLVDFIEAASDAIPYHSDSEEYHTYIRSTMVREYEELQAKGYEGGNVASYMLGSALWRLAVNDPRKDSGIEEIMTRTVRDIVLTRQAFHYGNERIFDLAFTRYVQVYGGDYPAAERRRLYRLCTLIEDEACKARKSTELTDPGAESFSYSRFLSRKLASTALIRGVWVNPPGHQTDDEGVWDIPEHKDWDEQ